ncbi:MAG: UDP-3-O-(3-hydroxymyristoyl)glucosamine N-acyltransferase, partial [Pseudomonadota bacterium]
DRQAARIDLDRVPPGGARGQHVLALERVGARSGGEIAPTAVVETDGLEANVIVEAFAVIARDVEIGRGSVIGPNVVIGPGCTIGRNTVIGAGSTIQCAHIGDNVIIHPGCRIGQDGFGLARMPNGFVKVPQVRAVVIQDDVELGANCTVDRGASRDTVIGKGCKIDNQVQIGHNVVMGCHCVVAGCVGIAGSVTMGDYVTLGGRVGLRDGISLGDGCSVAGMSGVGEDVPAGVQYAGLPAMEARKYITERMAIIRLARGASKR